MTRWQPFLIAVIVLSLSAKKGEADLRMAISDLRVSVVDVGDRDYNRVDLRFAAATHNEGRVAVLLSSKPMFLVGTDQLDRAGKWRSLGRLSWYDTGGIEYERCVALAPRASMASSDVNAAVFLSRGLTKP